MCISQPKLHVYKFTIITRPLLSANN